MSADLSIGVCVCVLTHSSAWSKPSLRPRGIISHLECHFTNWGFCRLWIS